MDGKAIGEARERLRREHPRAGDPFYSGFDAAAGLLVPEIERLTVRVTELSSNLARAKIALTLRIEAVLAKTEECLDKLQSAASTAAELGMREAREKQRADRAEAALALAAGSRTISDAKRKRIADLVFASNVHNHYYGLAEGTADAICGIIEAEEPAAEVATT